MQEKNTQRNISEEFLDYVNNFVKKVAQTGQGFYAFEKFVKIYAEKQDVNIDLLLKEITNLMVLFEKRNERLTPELRENITNQAKKCFVSDRTLQTIFNNWGQTKIFEKREIEKKPKKEKVEFIFPHERRQKRIKRIVLGGIGVVIVGLIFWIISVATAEPSKKQEIAKTKNQTINKQQDNESLVTTESKDVDKKRELEEELEKQRQEIEFLKKRIEEETQSKIELIAQQKQQQQELAAKEQREPKQKQQETKAAESASSKKQADDLVKQADVLFEQRKYDEACNLYVQANKTVAGTGNRGAVKFEKLAESLSADKEAPAYINTLKRAERIRNAK